MTGEDSHENFAILLGPLWQKKSFDVIKAKRIEILLCSFPGSPFKQPAEHLNEGCPRWSPRAASGEEEVWVAEIRDKVGPIAKQMKETGGVVTSDAQEKLSWLIAKQNGDQLAAVTDDIKSQLSGLGGGDWF